MKKATKFSLLSALSHSSSVPHSLILSVYLIHMVLKMIDGDSLIHSLLRISSFGISHLRTDFVEAFEISQHVSAKRNETRIQVEAISIFIIVPKV